MNLVNITQLKIPEIKVIRFHRFVDNRGYFVEHFRNSILFQNEEIESLKMTVRLLNKEE